MSMLILNGTIVNADRSERADLVIANGRIEAVGNFHPAACPNHDILDARGKYIFPGGFDPHVHLALPTPAGPSCDDFRSGSSEALAGGTTSIMDFVTPKRGESLPEALRRREAETLESLANCELHMGISEWNPALALQVTACMENYGISSFKAYLAYRESIGIDYKALEELMKIVGSMDGVVMVHCEEGERISNLQKEFLGKGHTRACFHAKSRPAETEHTAIERVLNISSSTGCRTYIVHVSTSKGAGLIAAAKKDGVKVYGETCPHYLLLDDSKYYETLPDEQVLPYIISPPLRAKEEQAGLWNGLTDRTFDVVATDHCPFNLRGQKDAGTDNFTRIPNGAGSIRHRLTLLYTYGVLPGHITMNQFVSLVSTRPAEIFGKGACKGQIKPGYDADLVIWNPDYEGIITNRFPHSRCDSEIYDGFKIHGNPETVILKGKKVFGTP